MLWWPLNVNHSAALRIASKWTNGVDKVWPGVGSRALEGGAGTAGCRHSGSEPSPSSCRVSPGTVLLILGLSRPGWVVGSFPSLSESQFPHVKSKGVRLTSKAANPSTETGRSAKGAGSGAAPPLRLRQSMRLFFILF